MLFTQDSSRGEVLLIRFHVFGMKGVVTRAKDILNSHSIIYGVPNFIEITLRKLHQRAILAYQFSVRRSM